MRGKKIKEQLDGSFKNMTLKLDEVEYPFKFVN